MTQTFKLKVEYKLLLFCTYLHPRIITKRLFRTSLSENEKKGNRRRDWCHYGIIYTRHTIFAPHKYIYKPTSEMVWYQQYAFYGNILKFFFSSTSWCKIWGDHTTPTESRLVCLLNIMKKNLVFGFFSINLLVAFVMFHSFGWWYIVYIPK